MADTVPTHFAAQFGRNVKLLAQQMDTRLQKAVTVKPITGEKMTFEQLGSLSATEIVGRNADTKISAPEHIRRWVFPQDYSVATLIDWTDDYKRVVDVRSGYAQSQAAAMNRKKDQIIIDALQGTALSDQTGSTSVPWSPSAYDGTNATATQLVIAHDYDEAGASYTTGLSIAKLRAARTILRTREVNTPAPYYIICTTAQIQDLLTDNQCTSMDYANVKALLSGQINSFYGFEFIESNLLNLDATATTERKCWALTRGAVGMCVGREVRSEMDYRPDKNHSLQITTYFAGGAARIDERELVEIRCEEPAAAS